MTKSDDAAEGDGGGGVAVRELFPADVEGVEGVGAVGAVFEEVFFGLGELFSGFVLAEAEATTGDTCGLYGEDKVVVVLTVEERHEALLPGKALVDEKILLVMPHGITEIDILDAPAVAFKFMDYHPPP